MAETETKKPPYYMEMLKKAKELAGDQSSLKQQRIDLAQKEKAVLEAISSEPKTVPEIAEVTALDKQLVFWLVNALRKYNKAETVAKRGDYMTYIRK